MTKVRLLMLTVLAHLCITGGVATAATAGVLHATPLLTAAQCVLAAPKMSSPFQLAAGKETNRPSSGTSRGIGGRYHFCPGNSYLRCARKCWKKTRSCIRSAKRSGLTSVHSCHRWLKGCYSWCAKICKR